MRQQLGIKGYTHHWTEWTQMKATLQQRIAETKDESEQQVRELEGLLGFLMAMMKGISADIRKMKMNA